MKLSREYIIFVIYSSRIIAGCEITIEEAIEEAETVIKAMNNESKMVY